VSETFCLAFYNFCWIVGPGICIDLSLGHGSGKRGHNDQLCIALIRDTEFKETKGTGGLVGRPDALVKLPGFTHL